MRDGPEAGSGGLSRRSVLQVGVAGAALGALGMRKVDAAEPPPAPATVPFFGRHQAGILTPQQRYVTVAVVDVNLSDLSELETMLRRWTKACVRLTAGQPAEPLTALPDLTPEDSGETDGTGAARLTVTVGFGASLFDGRFGSPDLRPAALVDLPRFGHDRLDPARTGGDLVIQACADDPKVALHAVRNLIRLSEEGVDLRWMQHGSSAATTGAPTPRNLLGFKDGTANLDVTDPAVLDRNVWAAASSSPAWMAHGTYLVVRRVRTLVEHWDDAKLSVQEASIGRHKTSGAPLGAVRESDPVRVSDLPVDSHIRLANPRAGQVSEDERLLRRGYDFDDGARTVVGPVLVKGKPVKGHQDSGLLFLAYQQDPRRQFVPIQTRLDAGDRLNEYLLHTGSGLFAVPGGVQGPGDFLGSALLRAAGSAPVATGPLITSSLGAGVAAVAGPKVSYADGVSVRVLSLHHFDPSEYAHGHLDERVAAAFLVEVHNGSRATLALSQGTASARTADGTLATRVIDLPKYDETAGRFSGALAPGATSQTSVAFDVPRDDLDHVVLEVAPGPQYAPLHFLGAVL